MKNITKQDRDG